MNEYAKKIVVRAGTLIGALSVCILVWVWGSVRPDGIYYDRYISGPTYWLFKDGKVRLTTPGEDGEISGRLIDTGGVYFKASGDWIMRGPANVSEPDVILKPSPFGLRMVCKDKGHPEWNRFYPRRGLAWLDSLRLLPKKPTDE